jgi:2,4'-dihydroxyacetophenone dioxygenase
MRGREEDRAMKIDQTAEVLKTLHIQVDDVPFVEVGPGLKMRVLQYRPEHSLLAEELEAAPGAESVLHRHLAPVLGWTTRGAWGHDRTYAYRPESYIFETPGVVHQFLNGPDVTRALYIERGDTELVDPDTRETIEVSALSSRMRYYLESCEAAGLPRPNVLT